ncbi:MAG TPA: hypothetical protein VNV44_05900 [Solirubrobacteraceae bacterium]|nr:hypothetical protein [Solirubrobacteraceae bacterium]
MTEIRSYRRVFDLERRVYTIDRMRLNPAGVPVRGIVYLLVGAASFFLLARMPLLGAPLRVLPWFVRDVGAPAALAAALTVIRIDGRAFHHMARSSIGYLTRPSRLVALGKRSSSGQRWLPEDLLFLPDGSDSRVARVRYEGPGAVLVLIAHRPPSPEARRVGRGRSARRLRLTAHDPARALTKGRVLKLGAGTSIVVAAERHDGRR